MPLEPTPTSPPLDLVYTWVDGSRFSHFVQRSYYKRWETVSPDNGWVRWADRGELRYSLRSVALNAPIFDRIFIVTEDGKGPAWLEPNDRVRLVSHAEIMPPEILPNFSSCSIESFLHRIPGLSEHFVYANDDFMFWAPVDRATFLEGSRPRIMHYDFPVEGGPVLPTDSGHVAGKKNADVLLDRRFGPARRKTICHTPVPLTKSGYQAVWDAFPTEVRAAAGRFRSARSLAFTNHLLPHFLVLSGEAVAAKAEGMDVCVAFHNSRWKNLAASYLKYQGRLPEDRARELLRAAPNAQFLWIECDGTTIANVLNERLSVPGPYEKSAPAT